MTDSLKRNFMLAFIATIYLLATVNEAKKRHKMRRFARFDLLENCRDREYINRMGPPEFKYPGEYVSGKFYINQINPPKKIMIIFIVRKCKTLSSCELVLSGTTDFCMLLEDKNEFYSSFYGRFQPDLKCPCKHGVYTYQNSTLSAEAVNAMIKFVPEYDDVYWNIIFKLHARGKPKPILTCINLVIRYDYARE